MSRKKYSFAFETAKGLENIRLGRVSCMTEDGTVYASSFVVDIVETATTDGKPSLEVTLTGIQDKDVLNIAPEIQLAFY